MSRLTEIQGLFSPAAVAAVMESLPVLKTSVLDNLFPKAVEHPFAAIGLADLETVVGTQPVVRRDGAPVPFSGRGDDVSLFAPRPVKPSVDITASELNDLKVIFGHRQSRESFVARKVDQLRQLVRNTTEGMASVVAATGKLTWPTRLDGGGLENYEMDFGRPARLDLTSTTAWDGAAPPTLAQVYAHLTGLTRAMAENGGGGNVAFLAGDSAFASLLALAQGWASTAAGSPIALKLENGLLSIGGCEVRHLADRYQSPLDKGWLAKVPAEALVGYSRDQGGTVFYLAVDSISLDGEARPFHIVAEAVPGDAAVRLIAQAKPVPVRSPRSLVLSKVVNFQ